MLIKRLAMIGLLFGAGVATTACTEGYGYSGLSVGYGNGGYYDGYGYDGYGYGGGYGAYPSYYGWYGDYYYPGTGIYVYDQYRRPYRWNDGQRRYWEQRRNGWRGEGGIRNDWNGFDRDRARRPDGGYGGERTPGIRGDSNRGSWRGVRPMAQGGPAVAPRMVNPGTGQQPRGWGGNRGGWRGRR